MNSAATRQRLLLVHQHPVHVGEPALHRLLSVMGFISCSVFSPLALRFGSRRRSRWPLCSPAAPTILNRRPIRRPARQLHRVQGSPRSTRARSAARAWTSAIWTPTARSRPWAEDFPDRRPTGVPVVPDRGRRGPARTAGEPGARARHAIHGACPAGSQTRTCSWGWKSASIAPTRWPYAIAISRSSTLMSRWQSSSVLARSARPDRTT